MKGARGRVEKGEPPRADEFAEFAQRRDRDQRGGRVGIESFPSRGNPGLAQLVCLNEEDGGCIVAPDVDRFPESE